MTLKTKVIKCFIHGFYMGGTTFFTVVGTNFIDQLITIPELQQSLIAGFIAGGLGFFVAMKALKIDDFSDDNGKKGNPVSCLKSKKGLLRSSLIIF